jgi:hypothetical protein
MKTLFKLVVAVLVLNAAVRGALAMWQYYQFKDAAQQIVLFSQRAEPEEIQADIVARATAMSVPVQPDDIKVSRDGERTVAEGSYTRPVEFLPNYPWPVKFTFIVDALSFAEASGPGRKGPGRK